MSIVHLTDEITFLRQANSVELIRGIGHTITDRERIDASAARWMDAGAYEWFFYLIDGRFPICHPFSDKFVKLQSDLFATHSVLPTSPSLQPISIGCRVHLSAQMHIVDWSNMPVKRFFTKETDAAVVAHIHLTQPIVHPERTVITCEWLHDGRLQWLSSMPQVIERAKQTKSMMKITTDTPPGPWVLNVYVQEQLMTSQSFQLAPHRHS